MIGSTTPRATCFGKLPSRGDFVKGHGQHQLIGLLDRWVSAAMERLATDPCWKEAYDRAAPLDFAFLGAHSPVAVIGHLRPSADASGRRFPFLIAAALERADQLLFRCAPAGLAQAYAAMAALAGAATDAGNGDLGELHASLDRADFGADFAAAMQSDPLGSFVRHTTLAELAALIGPPASPETLRRTILACGLLLRPVLGQPGLAIGKDLAFPLPAAPRHRAPVAALWLYLATAFLRRTKSELQVLVQERPQGARLIIGFNGATAGPLVSALAPDEAADALIALDDPAWIEQQDDLRTDYGIAKLSTYLGQSGLPLEALIATFREVFLGE